MLLQQQGDHDRHLVFSSGGVLVGLPMDQILAIASLKLVVSPAFAKPWVSGFAAFEDRSVAVVRLDGLPTIDDGLRTVVLLQGPGVLLGIEATSTFETRPASKLEGVKFSDVGAIRRSLGIDT